MTIAASPDRLLRTPPPPVGLYERAWERTGWRPYALQREVLTHTARNKVMAAGRRAGKSATGGQRLVPEAFRAWMELDELKSRQVRREYWIVGPEYSDSEKEFRVIWNALSRLGFLFDHPGSYNNPDAGVMSISLFDRAFRIHAQSAKYPANLVGEGLSGVVFSEAAKLKPSVWDKFIRPMLADFGGWAHFGSTPEGKNWFYDLWGLGQDPERPEWQSWRAPCWVNPYVYPGGCNEGLLTLAKDMRRKGQLDLFKEHVEFVDSDLGRHPAGIDPEVWSLFLDMSEERFNQEEAALFTEYVGRVFKDFDEEYHVTSYDWQANWETYACVDYGFTNPFVWLLVQIDPSHKRIHIVDEYYERGRTATEAGAEILSRGLAPRTVRAFYPDPASPGDTRTLQSILKIRAANPGSLTVQDRLEWIRRKLKLGSGLGGMPALTISRKCVNTIREFNDYRYPESAEKAAEKDRSAPENPLKKDDHTPEALGRLFSGLFGSPHPGNRTRQSRAMVGRG